MRFSFLFFLILAQPPAFAAEFSVEACRAACTEQSEGCLFVSQALKESTQPLFALWDIALSGETGYIAGRTTVVQEDEILNEGLSEIGFMSREGFSCARLTFFEIVSGKIIGRPEISEIRFDPQFSPVWTYLNEGIFMAEDILFLIPGGQDTLIWGT